MEVQTGGRPTRPWYGRGWAMALSALVLVAGLVMAGFGAAALLSASDTDDDASATRDEAAAMEDEAADLEARADEAVAAAEAATAEAEALDADTSALTDAVLAVRDDTDLAVAAGNAVTDCSSNVDEAAFISCTRDRLVPYEAALVTQRATIEELRSEVAALEEALR